MGYLLEREKTGTTPYVLVDEDKNYMKFEGECYHENVVEFFKEITAWLDRYLETDFERLTFDCKLQYFNSSTAKLLMNILSRMDSRASEERKVTVNWITTEENEIIIECGEDFGEEMSALQFNLVIAD